jgi:hypothetical protein
MQITTTDAVSLTVTGPPDAQAQLADVFTSLG